MVAPPDTAPPTLLHFDQIEEGVTTYDLEVSGTQLGLAETEVELDGPVAVSVRVGRTMEMFTIDVQLRAAVHGVCSRCLAPAGAAVEGELRFLLQRREGSDEEFEAVADDDDVDLVEPGARDYDLGPRLHDVLILELPLRLYCKPDCKGLCARCGQDLNAGSCDCAARTYDPRWEALAKLRS